jgi:oligosaccharide repeat unit polymerase
MARETYPPPSRGIEKKRGHGFGPTAIGALVAAAVLVIVAVPKHALPPGTATPILAGGMLVAVAELLAIRRHDVFEPIHLLSLCFTVLYVVHPLAIASRGTLDAYGQLGLDPRPFLPRALVLADLGFAALLVGYFLPRARPAASAKPSRAWDAAKLRRHRLWVGLVAAVLFAAFVVQQGGDLAVLHAGRSVASTTVFRQTSGYLYSAPLLFLPLGLSVLYTTRRWWSPRGVAGLSLVALSQASSFGTGSRSYFLPAASSTVLVWYLARDRRPRPIALVMLLLAVMTVGITLPREARVVRSQRVGRTVSAFDVVGGAREFTAGQDTAMVDSLSLELDAVPRALPYQYGRSYVGALARPVPRAVWAGKPGSGDEYLNNRLFPSYASRHIGFAFGFFGEPYLNFGIVGVLAVSVLAGLALRRSYEYLLSRPRDELAALVYALSWPFVFVYMRGSLGVDYQRQLILLLPLVWLYRRAELPAGTGPGRRSRPVTARAPVAV